MSFRNERVSTLIKQELSKIIFKNLDFPPGALVTITKVDVSAGCRHAKVYVSVFPSNRPEALLQYLDKHIYALQKILDKRLFMRPVPKIRFLVDKGGEKFSRINELLNG